MNDIVKRLRHGGFTIQDIDAACGRIEALERDVAEAKSRADRLSTVLRRLCEAAKPFAQEAYTHSDKIPDKMKIDDYDGCGAKNDITVGDLRFIRAVVEEAKRERDEALNELDAVYAALGTSDAEGAPEAAVTIESIFCERDALQARVERLEKALRPFAKVGEFMKRTPATRDVHLWFLAVEGDGINSHGSAKMLVADFLSARAALAEDGESNDRD